jgi:hypothetical protein
MPAKSKGAKWEGDFDAKEHERHFGKQVSGKGRDGKDAKGKGPDPRGDKPGGSGGAAGGGRGSAGTVPRDRLGDGAKRPAGKDQVRGAGGRAGDGEAGGDAPKPGKDAKGKPVKGKGVRIEPHESGEGSRAHFHPEVSADLKGDADYKHHVTEHAKHYAGYLTHKDKDQERGEAHRQAANLHARVGNALHAGGDTKPAPPPPMVFGPPGAAGAAGAGGASPGKDAMGRPLPGAPDGQRNPPGQDSTIGAQRRAGKPAGGAGAAGGAKGGQGKPGQGGPPMELVGKALYFGELRKGGERAGHKYVRRTWRGGRWQYSYDIEGERMSPQRARKETARLIQSSKDAHGVDVHAKFDGVLFSELRKQASEFKHRVSHSWPIRGQPLLYVFRGPGWEVMMNVSPGEHGVSAPHLVDNPDERSKALADAVAAAYGDTKKSLTALPLGTRRIPLLLVPA